MHMIFFSFFLKKKLIMNASSIKQSYRYYMQNQCYSRLIVEHVTDQKTAMNSALFILVNSY
jgi:hypothetical protein